MTEPTTEELERQMLEAADVLTQHCYTSRADAVIAGIKRLSDLEGKLGEARKLLDSVAHRLDSVGAVGVPLLPSDRQAIADSYAFVDKLTASEGGEDNSLSQGASVAHSSVRPETQHSAGDEG